MRTSVHVHEAIALSDLTVGSDRNQSLVVRISIFPDSVIPGRIPEVRDSVSHALLLLDGLPGGRPRQSVHAERFIDREPAVIHQASGCRAQTRILVPPGIP